MKNILILAVISSSTLATAQQLEVYKVKKGDTLSELLVDRTQSPLYSKDGSVPSHLNINRLTNQTAKKLEIGSYIMLPQKIKYEQDTTNLTQSSTARSGLLFKKLSKHQNIEVSAEFSAKEYSIKGASTARASENYKAKIKYIANSTYSPSLSLSIGNSSGIKFEDDKDLLVEFQPSVELEAMFQAYTNKKLKFSPMVSISEDSNIFYDTNYSVRRDQNLWLGGEIGYDIDLKNSKLELSTNLKSNIITNAEQDNDELNLLKASLNARINLTNNLFLATFLRTETIDIEAQELGLTFIYKL